MFRFKRPFPITQQLDGMDCGVACLKMVTEFYGKRASLQYLKEKTHLSKLGVSLADLTDAARQLHFKTLAVRASVGDLPAQAQVCPVIAHWKEMHFVVLYAIDRTKKGPVFRVADPALGRINYTEAEFNSGWTNNGKAPGYLLLLQPTPDFYLQPDEFDGPSERKAGFQLLVPHLRRHTPLLVQILLGVLITTVISLLFPFLSQSLIDKGINQQDVGFIKTILGVQISLFLFQLIVEIIREKLILHSSSQINLWVKSDFLNKLLRLPISFFDSTNFGDISQRLNDHERIQEFVSLSTVTAFFSVLNIVVFGALFAVFNPPIFLIYLIGTILYVAWVFLFLERKKILDYKVFAQMAFAQGNIQQIVNGIQEIKLNGSENRRRYELEKNSTQIAQLDLKNQYLQHWQLKGGGIINELKNMLILFVAAGAVVSGHITLGTLISIQYIAGQLNLPVNNLINFILVWHRTKLSFERIGEVHLRADEDAEQQGMLFEPKAGDLLLQNVSFRYGGESSPLVLNDVSIRIPQNKVTAIVGASGSGKTTLLKLLLKFYTPNSGSISADGLPINQFDSRGWRQLCGSVMQDGYIFDDSIVRNITESKADEPLDRDRLLQAVRIANIEEFIERLPAGYNTKIGASGLALSGGQRQRILIARAVYKNPHYLFFDEATSALDATNEREIVDNLNRFFQHKTVLVIAHRLSTVKHADNIIVLDRGRVIEQGSHAQLVRSQGTYFALISNQLELSQ